MKMGGGAPMTAVVARCTWVTMSSAPPEAARAGTASPPSSAGRSRARRLLRGAGGVTVHDPGGCELDRCFPGTVDSSNWDRIPDAGARQHVEASATQEAVWMCPLELGHAPQTRPRGRRAGRHPATLIVDKPVTARGGRCSTGAPRPVTSGDPESPGKPGSVNGPEGPLTTMSLGSPSPTTSNALPGGPNEAGRFIPPYWGFLPVRFTKPERSPAPLVRSYRTLSPLPRRRERRR